MREQLHVRIVPMTADHLDEVAELERICFSTPWSRNMLAEELDNALSAFLVALDESGKVVGYAGLQVVLYHQRGGAPGMPPTGNRRKAAAGVFGLCPGQSSGVFDAGGTGVQL